MIPGAHRLRLFALDPSAPAHAADAAHPGLNFGDGFRTDALGFVKTRAARVVGLEDPLDDHAVAKHGGLSRAPHWGVRPRMACVNEPTE
jgi:hypothetical protein